MIRSVALLAFVSLVFAESGEATPPVVPQPPTSDPIAIKFHAAGPSSLMPKPGQPMEASGGVTFSYEEVQIACDSLSCLPDTYPGSVNPVLDVVKLLGGPLGPADGRVLIDTTQSHLAHIAFKGELHPVTVIMRRQEPLAARPTLVRYQVEASDVQDFSGMLVTATGERQYVIWADHIVLDLEAPLDSTAKMTGIGTPVLRAMHMYGRPARDGLPSRDAVVLRMPAGKVLPKEEAKAERVSSMKLFGMRCSATTQSLIFDEDGKFVDHRADGPELENLDGEGLMPAKKTSQPKIGP